MAKKTSGIASDNKIIKRRIRSTDKDEKTDACWWRLPKGTVHQGVTAAMNAIDTQSFQRADQLDKLSELYDGRRLSTGDRKIRPGLSRIPKLGRLAVNVVKGCIDTAAAKIAKNVPKPMFLTSRGDYSLKRKAKNLTRYVEGVFYDSDVHSVAQSSFFDACIWGTGVIGLSWEDSEHGPRLRFERILPDEILIDEEEGRYGTPRQLHHARWVSIDVLCELYPQNAGEIRLHETKGSYTSTRGASQILVRESWHLPSGTDADDGKHAVTIEGCDLLDEAYEADYFPFCFFRWTDARIGFWGVGLAEELIEIQYNINRTADAIQKAQNLVSAPRVFVEKGSQVVPAHLNNNRDRLPIIQYVGKPPVFQTPQAQNAEMYTWLQTLVKMAYDVTGISQMAATATKTPGLNSGAAIREFNDTTSERFVLTGQRWEDLFLDMARKIIDMSRRMNEASGSKGLSVKSPDGRFIHQIKWKECNLDEDKYFLKVYSTSWLPTTPAARMEAINEYAQAGLLSKETARKLMDYPDLEEDTSLATAAENDVDRTIEQILEEGKSYSADEFTNLQMCVVKGMQAALNAKDEGYPEENVSRLRAWVDECRQTVQGKQPAPEQFQHGAAPDQGPPAQPANDNGAPQQAQAPAA